MCKEAERSWDSALQHQTQQDIQEAVPVSELQTLNVLMMAVDTLNGYGQSRTFYNREKKKFSEKFVSAALPIVMNNSHRQWLQ